MNSEYGSRVSASMLEALKQLIQANHDSAQGFQEAAADIEDPEIGRLFRQWSVQKFADADQLQACVHFDELRSPVPEGTWLHSWRRIWLSVRGALNIGDRAEVLRELERAEGRVSGIIETLLGETHNPLLIDALRQQLIRVRDITEALRKLNNSLGHKPIGTADTWTSAMNEETVVGVAVNPSKLA